MNMKSHFFCLYLMLFGIYGKMWEDHQQEVILSSETFEYCRSEICQEIPAFLQICETGRDNCKKYRSKDILSDYGGLFFFEENLKEMTIGRNERSTNPVIKCCPTNHGYRSINTWIQNIHGGLSYVIGFGNLNQYIPDITCDRKGSCKKRCDKSNSLINLLVWSKLEGLTFKLFDVPTYCSCI